jgi:sensor histidine kinase regulating citrate/malate metabolism
LVSVPQEKKKKKQTYKVEIDSPINIMFVNITQMQSQRLATQDPGTPNHGRKQATFE